MDKIKSGFVTVVGRPNVGKSTFLNKVMGQKILIESDKPQATRNRIHCVYTEERGQVIFVDTPGIHKPHHKLGENLVKHAKDSLNGVDVAILMVEPDEIIGSGDHYVARIVSEVEIPVILCINKVDIIKPNKLIPLLVEWNEKYKFAEMIPISAKTGENVDKVVDLVFSYLKEGPQYYPADMITDRPEEFLIGEIIREKVFNLLYEEIPYSVAVDLRAYEMRNNKIYIAADIIAERASQKGMIIGKQGSMLKKIGHLARRDIEKFMGYKVFLDLHVRHKSDWRNKQEMLNKLGYTKE